jgi:hypothetical protein
MEGGCQAGMSHDIFNENIIVITLSICSVKIIKETTRFAPTRGHLQAHMPLSIWTLFFELGRCRSSSFPSLSLSHTLSFPLLPNWHDEFVPSNQQRMAIKVLSTLLSSALFVAASSSTHTSQIDDIYIHAVIVTMNGTRCWLEFSINSPD